MLCGVLGGHLLRGCVGPIVTASSPLSRYEDDNANRWNVMTTVGAVRNIVSHEPVYHVVVYYHSARYIQPSRRQHGYHTGL